MVEDAKEATGSMGDDTPVARYQIIVDRFHIILDKILVKLQIHGTFKRIM